uniref:LysR substrate-binding domain-containing protein n=1 Tax=Klebsiella pneumoniae TaxID=573 RepID=UPI0021B13488
EDLKADKYDMAICSLVADENEIEFLPLISQELVLVTSCQHPLAQQAKEDISLEEAIAYPFIFFLRIRMRSIIDSHLRSITFSHRNRSPGNLTFLSF